MHELSVAQAIADTAAARAAGRKVTEVAVRIGYLRQIVPDSLTFSWELLTEGTDLGGSRLAIDHVPAVIACRACDRETVLEVPLMICPACGGSDVALLSGEEFQLVSLDLAEVA